MAQRCHGCNSTGELCPCASSVRGPLSTHPHFIPTRPFIARGTTLSFSFCRECSTGSSCAAGAPPSSFHQSKASRNQTCHPAWRAGPAHLTFFPHACLSPVAPLLPPSWLLRAPRPSVHVSSLAAGRWRAHVCPFCLSIPAAAPPPLSLRSSNEPPVLCQPACMTYHPVPTDFDFQCLLPTVTKHKLTHNLGEGRGSQHE